MWPDRRLVELFEIEHPIVLAPMAGLGTIGLAASVSEAGGLGSIGCATMQPHFVAKTIHELRELTSKPINVNFFCHGHAQATPDREHAWHDRLLPYYRELGIDYESPRSRLDIPPFGDAVCTVVEDTKPEVVSFHFGLPAPALLARVKAAGCASCRRQRRSRRRYGWKLVGRRASGNVPRYRTHQEHRLLAVLVGSGRTGRSDLWSYWRKVLLA
jgi:nitronate monooxygenase